MASQLLRYKDVDSANAVAAGLAGSEFNPYRLSNGFIAGFRSVRGKNGLNLANGVEKGDTKPAEEAIRAR